MPTCPFCGEEDHTRWDCPDRADVTREASSMTDAERELDPAIDD